MQEFWNTLSQLTTCFAVKTAKGTYQNKRILELKTEFNPGVQNAAGRILAGRLPGFPSRNPNACRCQCPASTIGGMNPGSPRTALCFLAVAFAAVAAMGEEPKTTAPEPATVITPTDYLALPAVGQYGRLPLQRDAIEAEHVAGTWKEPT